MSGRTLHRNNTTLLSSRRHREIQTLINLLLFLSSPSLSDMRHKLFLCAGPDAFDSSNDSNHRVGLFE